MQLVVFSSCIRRAAKEDGFELGADSLDVGGSYARLGARLVEVAAHQLEPREPLVVPLRVSGHEA